jgi:hypothetical protein
VIQLCLCYGDVTDSVSFHDDVLTHRGKSLECYYMLETVAD